MASAEELLALALSRPATLGEGRLICVDGPSGSGKSTLAARVAALAAPLDEVRVVRLDDLYEGWTGLPHVGRQLDTLLLPLARGEAGHYRRYDWHAAAFAETVTVPPAPLLVLEGVGSGAAAYDSLRTVLAWVEAPREERRRRGLARDGETFAPHWDAWAAAEAEHFARDRTRERADLVFRT